MNREVVRCVECKLIQYRSRRTKCPRCAEPLPEAVVKVNDPPPVVSIDPPAFSEGANVELIQHLGARIRAVRQYLGLSHLELSNLSGAGRSYLSRIESVHITPSVATVEKICEAFGITVHDLFSEGWALSVPDWFTDELLPELMKFSPAKRAAIFKRLTETYRKIA